MSTRPVLVPDPVLRPNPAPPEPFNLIERVMLHHGDPRSIIFSIIGAAWAFYFLWTHQWFFALTAVVLATVLGRLFSVNLDEVRFSRTILGKMMLLHLHPANLTIQTVAGVYLIYAVWAHSGLGIMMAGSAIFAGHLWGWDEVHNAF
ncbi:MAG TPA: hypothetical protein VKW06_09525 [Candidatus Angelobacter sp.]|nr:hypothetical protein [Candidatus Angelobacter sp.]